MVSSPSLPGCAPPQSALRGQRGPTTKDAESSLERLEEAHQDEQDAQEVLDQGLGGEGGGRPFLDLAAAAVFSYSLAAVALSLPLASLDAAQ